MTDGWGWGLLLMYIIGCLIIRTQSNYFAMDCSHKLHMCLLLLYRRRRRRNFILPQQPKQKYESELISKSTKVCYKRSSLRLQYRYDMIHTSGRRRVRGSVSTSRRTVTDTNDIKVVATSSVSCVNFHGYRNVHVLCSIHSHRQQRRYELCHRALQLNDTSYSKSV